MNVWFLFHNSMMYVKFLFFILLIMALKTGVEADVETDKMIGKAVDTVVRDFMNVEKINTNPKNSFGYWVTFVNKTIPYLIRYFTQLTPLSKKLSRDARLVNKAMEELDKMVGHGENLELGANNLGFF